MNADPGCFMLPSPVVMVLGRVATLRNAPFSTGQAFNDSRHEAAGWLHGAANAPVFHFTDAWQAAAATSTHPHAMSEGRKRRAAAAAASVALTSTKPSDVLATLRKFQPAKPAKPKKKRGAGGGGDDGGGAGRAASPGARKKARTAAPKPSRGAAKACARPVYLNSAAHVCFTTAFPATTVGECSWWDSLV